jgi:serine/threonine-protein kinase
MVRIESLARYSALSPLHDIRLDLAAVQARMQQVREDMQQAGALANGPGHYALGWGHWTLDDREKAAEHLRMAWDAGYREPRVAFALAVALGREYQEKLLEAERIPAAGQREDQKRAIESRLRDPALAFLRQVQGSDAPSPAYLEALLAFYEGRLDNALERLRAQQSDLPWFYEAPMLRGSLLQARAWKRWNQGERDAAHADFKAGREALMAAAASGRSAPAVHAALAELEHNALIMEMYGQGEVEPAFQRGTAAVATALAAQPDHAPSLILQAALFGQFASFRMDRGEKAEDLVQQAVASAAKAVQAGPGRADARIALGKAYYQWGNARQEQNLDPREQLALGLQALKSLSKEKRDYTVENHLGLIQQTWSDFEEQSGGNPSEHLNGAITAYEGATRMEPRLLPAWINLGTCLRQRSALSGAAHPEADLQAALKVLDQARSLNPSHFVPCFVQGKVHHDLALRRWSRGEDPGPEFQRALASYRQGLAINPRIPHLHNGLGLAQAQRSRLAWEAGGDSQPLLAEAKESCRRAVAVAPNQVFGYLNLGDLLIWQARKGRGAAAARLLEEASRWLAKGLVVSPGNKEVLANLGRLEAARSEMAVRAGMDPSESLARGESILAKVLALNPRDQGARHYLGELRSAAANWKALHHSAASQDFERAAEPFLKVLDAQPDFQESTLALARLYLDRAAWERAVEQDPGPSLARAGSHLERIRSVRPGWAEPLALLGGMTCEAAAALAPGHRGRKAREALQFFNEAFTLNKNLIGEWKPWAGRAQQWATRGE